MFLYKMKSYSGQQIPATLFAVVLKMFLPSILFYLQIQGYILKTVSCHVFKIASENGYHAKSVFGHF